MVNQKLTCELPSPTSNAVSRRDGGGPATASFRLNASPWPVANRASNLAHATVLLLLRAARKRGVELVEVGESPFHRAARDAGTLASVIARLGVAEVRALSLTWEDCEDLLRPLGFSPRVEVIAA